MFFFLSTETTDSFFEVIFASFMPKSYVSPTPRVRVVGTDVFFFASVRSVAAAVPSSEASVSSGEAVPSGKVAPSEDAVSPGASNSSEPSTSRSSKSPMSPRAVSSPTPVSTPAPTSISASSNAISFETIDSLVPLIDPSSAAPVSDRSNATTRIRDKQRFIVTASCYLKYKAVCKVDNAIRV